MEFKQISESRASVYWFLSTLFAKELEQAQIDSLTAGEGADLLAQLAEEPALTTVIREFKEQLEGLSTNATAELELKVQFADLFLMDYKHGAPPYASVYLSKGHLLMQDPHHAMLKQLGNMGVEVVEGFREPADHIAIELDCLGNLIIQGTQSSSNEAALKQLSFINNHMASWLPRFKNKAELRQDTPFYNTLIRFLCLFIEQDVLWLESQQVSVSS